jgi:hypothetical protein
MVSDRFIDLEETGHLWMSGWRCMNCGYVVDPVTERNRRLQAQELVGVAHSPQTTEEVEDLSPLFSIASHDDQAA